MEIIIQFKPVTKTEYEQPSNTKINTTISSETFKDISSIVIEGSPKHICIGNKTLDFKRLLKDIEIISIIE